MAATHHDDISLTLGDEWLIIGKLLDENGDPLDLMTPGLALSWTLVGPDGNQIPEIASFVTIEKKEGGIAHITIDDAITRRLNPARYMDSIRIWIDDQPATQWTGIILAEADPFHPVQLLLFEGGA